MWRIVAMGVAMALGCAHAGGPAATHLEVAPPTSAVSTGSSTLDRNQAELLDRVNTRRVAMGLRRVEHDDTLGRACADHARYLSENAAVARYSPNVEDPGRLGASKSGASCARMGLVEMVDHSIENIVEKWLASASARRRLLSPALTRIGISVVVAWGFSIVVVGFAFGEAATSETIVYPPDGATRVRVDVPRTTWLDPIVGIPITVQLPSSVHDVANAAALLRDAEGHTVQARLTNAPPEALLDRAPALVLEPQRALRPGTHYTASFEAQLDGVRRSWTTSFATMDRVALEATDGAGIVAAQGKPVRLRGVVLDNTRDTASVMTSGARGILSLNVELGDALPSYVRSGDLRRRPIEVDGILENHGMNFVLRVGPDDELRLVP